MIEKDSRLSFIVKTNMGENIEYSGNNAWLLNFNNGNQNNNNRYNSYYVRAVAASQQNGGGFVLTDNQRNELEYKYYSRSIDDSWIVHYDKNKILNDMPLIREKYKQFGLELHPDKYYFQHYSKGIRILNVMQKPGRTYVSNRPITNCFRKIHWWNLQAHENVAFQRQNCEKFAAIINSYLGQLKNFDEFNTRKHICEMVSEEWSKVMYPDRENFFKMNVRKRFKTRSRINRRIKHKRQHLNKLVKNYIMTTQPIRSFGPEAKAVAKEKINDSQWVGRANIQDFTQTVGEGENQTEQIVHGMKQWVEKLYDHEPTAVELAELAAYVFE